MVRWNERHRSSRSGPNAVDRRRRPSSRRPTTKISSRDPFGRAMRGGPPLSGARSGRSPILLPAAARKALRHRLLAEHASWYPALGGLTGATAGEVRGYLRELHAAELADRLIDRGADAAFAREFPQGPALYALVRALKPRRAVETGVRPGYSSAWILAALDRNGRGELTSVGPGSSAGRTPGVENVSVGQFVPPSLRARWILQLGNTEERLRALLGELHDLDLFLYDNGTDARRARFELRSAWSTLSERGVLLAHHADATPAWGEFCRGQGVPPQLLDRGPPALGALAMRDGR